MFNVQVNKELGGTDRQEGWLRRRQMQGPIFTDRYRTSLHHFQYHRPLVAVHLPGKNLQASIFQLRLFAYGLCRLLEPIQDCFARLFWTEFLFPRRRSKMYCIAWEQSST